MVHGPTSLHEAARNGDVKAVQNFLNGSNINAQDNYGMTALHWAVWKDSKDVVKLLRDAGAKLDIRDSSRITPLERAITHKLPRSIEIIHVLLGSDTDIKATDEDGKTALHYAARSGNKEVIQALLDSGVDINAVDKDGKTALHYAAQFGDRDTIKVLLYSSADRYMYYKNPIQALPDSGLDIKAVDKDNKTALHYAAQSGNIETIKVLLDSGADINSVDKDGKTALHYAAKRNFQGGNEVIIVLLERGGADIQVTEEVVKLIVGNFGIEVVEALLEKRRTDIQITEEVVKAAAKNEKSGQEVIAILLKRGGADIQVTEEVVKLIVGNFGIEVVEALLEKRGTDIQITEEVVKAATENKRSGQEVMAILLEKGTQNFIVRLHDRKEFQVFWRCRCGRKFEARIPGTNPMIAANFLRWMDWNVKLDGPVVRDYFKFKWLETIVWAVMPYRLGKSSSERSQDLEARDSGLGRAVPDSSNLPRRESRNYRSSSEVSDINKRLYVCLFTQKDRKWWLRHAKVHRPVIHNSSGVQGTQAQGPTGNNEVEAQTSSSQDMDQDMDEALFLALREKLRGKRTSFSLTWRSWAWILRKFSPVVISGVELWEFDLYPTPKLVNPITKDKLPYENGETYHSKEWNYKCLSGQELSNFKRLIHGKYLLHLLQYPDHAKPGSRIWPGLPKKIHRKLIYNESVVEIGWGFQIEHEWDPMVFTLLMCPIIIVGFITAITLTVIYHWPPTIGLALSLGPVTIVTFVNSQLGGIIKQKGLSK